MGRALDSILFWYGMVPLFILPLLIISVPYGLTYGWFD